MPGLAGCWQGSTLAADSPVGICDSPVFFTPGRRGQDHIGQLRGVGRGAAIADHNEITTRDGGKNGISLGHAGRRIGADDPQRLDLFVGHGAEHIDRLQARFCGHGRGVPERLDCSAVGRVFNFQMAGEHIGHAAHFTPAHGVGLACHRKRAHAGLADPACCKVAIDDRVDFVSAG